MPTQQEIFNKKNKFLNDREAILNRKVTIAEKKLLSVIIDNFVDSLEKSNGIITNNGKNITLTQALEKIFKEFNNTLNKSLINDYISDISKAQALNERYFGHYSTGNKFEAIKNRVVKTVNRRLGINNDGNLRVGGYLDNFLKDSRIKTEVQELVTRAITSESSITTIKNDLKILIAGDSNIQGQLSNHYRTFINDTYQQVDNLESSLYANELGLQAAFYSGGTINTTRKFCCQRNGLVFTVKEIKSWQSLKFQGRNKNYNPITDQGGYNCRHRYRYVINSVAILKRSDLRINKNGVLVPKKKGSKPKYNQCA